MNDQQKQSLNVVYWLVAIVMLLLFQSQWQAAATVEPVPYFEFERALAEGRVAEVVIGDRIVTGVRKQPEGNKRALVATLSDRRLSGSLRLERRTGIAGRRPVEGGDSSRSRKMTSRRSTSAYLRSPKALRWPGKDPRQTEIPGSQPEKSCQTAHRRGFGFDDHGFRRSAR